MKTTLLLNACFSYLSAVIIFFFDQHFQNFFSLSKYELIFISCNLFLFSMAIVYLSLNLQTLWSWVKWVTIADIAWVMLTSAMASLFHNNISMAGLLLLAGVNLIVSTFAILQWHHLKRLSSGFNIPRS